MNPFIMFHLYNQSTFKNETKGIKTFHPFERYKMDKVTTLHFTTKKTN